MISVAKALEIVRSQKRSFGTEEIYFEWSLDRILAEDIRADRDFPAFHRASMDGIAIRWDDWQQGARSFQIIGEQFAGKKPLALAEPGTCLEIMTGAVMPAGADMVIRYEDCTIAGGRAVVAPIEVAQWMNIHRQGTDAKADEVLIESGKKINAGDIGILASVGKVMVRVHKLPSVAIISTGDELVAVNSTPLRYQIRRSNNAVLAALARKEGLIVEDFHLNDNEAEIRAELPRILARFDVVLMSGGVSKGKRDYLPELLQDLGVTRHFHGVQQRPGKPMWFGSTDHTVVFGFPGNPVSTLVCFQVYFRTWLAASLGYALQQQTARLTTPILFKPALTYFVPVQLRIVDNETMAIPNLGHGSGDLVNLSQADAFIELPADRVDFEAGEVFELIGGEIKNGLSN